MLSFFCTFAALMKKLSQLVRNKDFITVRTWLKDTLGRQTLMLLSFFVGVFGATVAIVVKNLLHFTSTALSTAFPEAELNYLYLAFPMVGIFLTVLYVKYFVRDNINHGVSIVLNAIIRGKLGMKVKSVHGKEKPHE